MANSSFSPTNDPGVALVATGLSGLTSLSAVSALGAGTAMDGGVCHASHTMVVTTSAGVTAGVVQLQGSLDGTNWFNLPGASSVTTTTASTTTTVAVTSCAARMIRAAITTVITGGTITAVVGMV
jgi:hypothetical protein